MARLPFSGLAQILLLGVAVGPVAAEPEPTPARHEYSQAWTGLYLGAGVVGGPGFLVNDRLRDSLGYVIGAKLSGAVILNVIHLQLAYLRGIFSARANGHPIDLHSHSLSASLGLHPGFLLNLYGPGAGYVLSSVYLQIGISAERVRADFRDRSLNQPWEAGWHYGVGLDVPIDSADDGEAFWLGFNYRLNRVSVDLRQLDPIALSTETDLRQHLFLIRFSYRSNGLPF